MNFIASKNYEIRRLANAAERRSTEKNRTRGGGCGVAREIEQGAEIKQHVALCTKRASSPMSLPLIAATLPGNNWGA
ncbi:hypothetical protein Ancab_005817 [Ancistrocladus abbreviatus]